MDERISQLERAVKELEERNRRVEADKAWETSVFRRATIALTTYACAAAALMSIGSVRPFLDALIPVVGYVLSVQSLPILKRWWLSRRR